MKIKTILSLSLAALAIVGCKQEEKETVLTVEIKNVIGSSNVGLNTRSYEHPSGHTYTLSNFKYFITDIKLLSANEDTLYLLKQPLLVDANREETAVLDEMKNIPTGFYEKVFVTFGVKESKNKPNGLTGFYDSQMAVNSSNAEGYYHMMVTGEYDSLKTNTKKKFEIMTNAVGTNNNSFEVEIPASSFLYNTSTNIKLVVDFNEFFVNPARIDFKDISGDISGNQEKQDLINTNAKTSISAKISEVD